MNIQDFQNEYVTIHVSKNLDDKVNEMALDIEKTGIKHKDACHVACAILSECDYFLTTDDRLLKYQCDGIQLINPVDLIKLLEE